jgi:hypothetical protein
MVLRAIRYRLNQKIDTESVFEGGSRRADRVIIRW